MSGRWQGEQRRRWFTAEIMDLTVWVDDEGLPIGFQLAYDDASGARKALTFHKGESLRHEILDDGEDRPLPLQDGPDYSAGWSDRPCKAQKPLHRGIS